MSIKLHIKNVKPYTEVSPKLDGKKQSYSFGIKVPEAKESEELKEDFRAITSNTALELAIAKSEALEEEGDKTDETFYMQRESLRDEIQALVKQQETDSLEFYKKQILFVKNASITVTEEDGKTTRDILVPDSTKAAPIESLWANPEECLAVLLDTYFQVQSIRDSLIKEINIVLFNVDTSAKGKN